MNNIEASSDLFNQGYSCAQAICAAFGPRYGIDRDTCLRLSSALGGGVGRQGDTCGAVVGALIILGLDCGAIVVEDPAAKAQAYARASEFISRFNELHKTVTCRELMGVDISTPEGMKRAGELGLSKTICPVLVKDAASILQSMIDKG